jgi:DNA invertase Pin-like site-specific DNA recombinase
MSDGISVPVVSYARISLDKRKDEHGVADQHRVNRATAERLGWTVAHEFTDNDRPASRGNVVRDEFEELLRVLRAGRLRDGGQVRGVVVLADDRLYRRAGDYERFVDALTFEHGRVFADRNGAIDLYADTADVQGLLGVALAKGEIRKIRRRLKRSHRARAEDGVPVGGTRPFGWSDDRRTLHPREAPLVAKAVADFASGRSLNSIVLEWRAEGLRTSLGNEWSARSLKVLMGNPRLCGWRRLNGEIVRDGSGNPVVGQWEPIVTPQQWEAVDAILSARRGHAVHPDGSVGLALASDFREFRYLLSGILRCGKPLEAGGICGAPMRVKHQKDCRSHIYTCVSKTRGGCAGVGRNGAKVDEYITEAVLAKLEERQIAAVETVRWSGDEELNRLVTQRETLAAEWHEGGISDEFFFPRLRKLEERIGELRNEQRRHSLAVERQALDVDDIRERWFSGALDMSQKRAYIREALLAVIVHPAGPAGRGRSAFRPELLQLVWRED